MALTFCYYLKTILPGLWVNSAMFRKSLFTFHLFLLVSRWIVCICILSSSTEQLNNLEKNIYIYTYKFLNFWKWREETARSYLLKLVAWKGHLWRSFSILSISTSETCFDILLGTVLHTCKSSLLISLQLHDNPAQRCWWNWDKYW